MTFLPRLASLVFNQPHAITPEAAEAIVAALQGRLGEIDLDLAALGRQHEAQANAFVGRPVLGDDKRYRGYRLTERGAAIVPIQGELVNRGSWLGASSGLVSYEGLRHTLRAVAADPQAQSFARAFRAAEGARPTWIAASTHAGEQAAVLALHRRLRQRWPRLLLLWAPRHPERFRPVAYAAVQAGFRTATRQMTHQPDAADDVFVVDTLGELARFYACADVAFVGGSLEDIGGHNLLEPAAAGTAMVTGPHLRNFADIAAQLEAAGALRIGADQTAVGDAL